MTMKQISTVIKEKRKELHLTQQNVADALFVDRGTVSKWERDKGSPDILQIQKLAELFETTADELLENKTDRQRHLSQEQYDYYEMMIVVGLFFMAYLMGPLGVPGILIALHAAWKHGMPPFIYVLGLAILFYCGSTLVIYLAAV